MEILLLLLPVALLGFLGLDGNDDKPASGAPPDSDQAVRTGTSAAETLAGTGLDDLILAAGGPDLVNGRSGDDFLVGEGGNDTLAGNIGDDILLGGPGNDTLQGGQGDDLLLGGANQDQLLGGEGDDVLLGGTDFDRMFGGDGDDVVIGLEITSDEWETGFFGELEAELRTAINSEYGPAGANLFPRISAGIISANVEQPDPSGQLFPRADIVSGGDGNDTLVGDFGDVLTGGGTNTADLFILSHNVDANGATVSHPMAITDFETVDRIVIDPGTATGQLSFSVEQDTGVLIRFGGEAVVVIDGVFDTSLVIPRVVLNANPSIF